MSAQIVQKQNLAAYLGKNYHNFPVTIFFRNNMSVFLIVLAFILFIIGLIGSFAPIIPGLPLGWIGLLIAFFSTNCTISIWTLIITLILVIIVSILDYVIPAKMVKISGGTKSGKNGALYGSIAGIFFINPIILIFGSFIGAFIGELINDSKDIKKAFKSAFSSFLGFLFSSGLKAFLVITFILILILNLAFGWF